MSSHSIKKVTETLARGCWPDLKYQAWVPNSEANLKTDQKEVDFPSS